MKIPHKITGAILFEYETRSVKVCIKAAVEAKADLRGGQSPGGPISWGPISWGPISISLLEFHSGVHRLTSRRIYGSPRSLPTISAG